MNYLWSRLMAACPEERLSLRLLCFLAIVRLLFVIRGIIDEIVFVRVQRGYELPISRGLLLLKSGNVQVFLCGRFLKFGVLTLLCTLLVLGIHPLIPSVLKWVVRAILLRGDLVLRYGLAWILFHVNVGTSTILCAGYSLNDLQEQRRPHCR